MSGILLAAVASLCFGTSAIFARLGLRHIKPSVGAFFSVISSLIVVGLLALIMNSEAIASLSLMAIAWFGLIGITNFVISRQSNYCATKYIGVARANPILSSSPLFAMIMAISFLGEAVNTLILTGTICIMIGLILLVSSK